VNPTEEINQIADCVLKTTMMIKYSSFELRVFVALLEPTDNRYEYILNSDIDDAFSISILLCLQLLLFNKAEGAN